MRLTEDEILQIISKEIRWHEANYPFMNLEKSYMDAFIEGMKQIEKVILKAKKEGKETNG